MTSKLLRILIIASTLFGSSLLVYTLDAGGFDTREAPSELKLAATPDEGGSGNT